MHVGRHSLNPLRTGFLQFITACVCAAFSPLAAAASNDESREPLAKLFTTQTSLKNIARKDIPKELRSQKTTEETPTLVTNTFTRNGLRILEVSWRKDWKGEKSRMFSATIYHGNTRLAEISRTAGRTAMEAAKGLTKYRVEFSTKDDGRAEVLVASEKGDFFDDIIVQGRSTRLLDDRAYTRAVIAFQIDCVLSLIDALKSNLAKKQKT